MWLLLGSCPDIVGGGGDCALARDWSGFLTTHCLDNTTERVPNSELLSPFAQSIWDTSTDLSRVSSDGQFQGMFRGDVFLSFKMHLGMAALVSWGFQVLPITGMFSLI